MVAPLCAVNPFSAEHSGQELSYAHGEMHRVGLVKVTLRDELKLKHRDVNPDFRDNGCKAVS